MDIMRYQYVWYKTGTRKAFSIWKFWCQRCKDVWSCSGRPITGKVDEIVEKVEQDQHISSYDIDKELNINHKTVLNHLEKAGYKKELDVWMPYLTVWFSEKFNESNFHLRIIVNTERNQTIFETIYYGRWKMDHNNNVWKRSWSKQGSSANDKARIDAKKCVCVCVCVRARARARVCVVGLERNRSLRAVVARLNDWF